MPDPLYRQIAEDLRQQIESGELPPGSQLRTELELREHYDASRNTIRDAVKLLITRGLVATRPGQGTFVVDKIEPFTITLDIKTGFGEGERIEITGRRGEILIRKAPSSALETMFAGKSAQEWRELYAGTDGWGPDLGREIVEE